MVVWRPLAVARSCRHSTAAAHTLRGGPSRARSAAGAGDRPAARAPGRGADSGRRRGLGPRSALTLSPPAPTCRLRPGSGKEDPTKLDQRDLGHFIRKILTKTS